MFQLSQLSYGSVWGMVPVCFGLVCHKGINCPSHCQFKSIFDRLKTLCREDCCQCSHEYDVFKSAQFVLNSLFQSLKMLFDLFMCTLCNVAWKPETTTVRWLFLSRCKVGGTDWLQTHFLIHRSQHTFSPHTTDTFYTWKNVVLRCFFCDQLLWSKFLFLLKEKGNVWKFTWKMACKKSKKFGHLLSCIHAYGYWVWRHP